MGITDFHPRIYPSNYPLLERFDRHHPAVQALQVHAESRDVCVCKEIEWPKLGNKAIEQAWYSNVRQKQYLFSEFAYEFISYDLVLDGWLEMPPELTRWERDFLEKDKPLMEAMLRECEEAATRSRNRSILPLIKKAIEFIEAYDQAIAYRLKELSLPKSRSAVR